jgi:hypothetical protein
MHNQARMVSCGEEALCRSHEGCIDQLSQKLREGVDLKKFLLG